MRQVFTITNAHCQGCADKIAKLVGELPGVSNVQGSFEKREVSFDTDREYTLEALNQQLAATTSYRLAAQGTPERIIVPPFIQTYAPFFLLLSISLLITAGISLWKDAHLHDMMRYFMGSFFLVFGGVKFVNVKGFAMSFAEYDILARHARWYALAYPFLELYLAFSFLLPFHPITASGITAIVMSIGAFGVWQALRRGAKIQCACVGTYFSLPLSWLTFIEDVGMALMAIGFLLNV